MIEQLEFSHHLLACPNSDAPIALAPDDTSQCQPRRRAMTGEETLARGKKGCLSRTRFGPKAEVPIRSPTPVERCQLWFEKARISVDSTVPLAVQLLRSKLAPRPVGQRPRR